MLSFDPTSLQPLIDLAGGTAAFAASIRTTRQAVENWLQQRGRPSLRLLLRLADLHHLDSLDPFFRSNGRPDLKTALIAQTGSLARAARRLRIPKSTLSEICTAKRRPTPAQRLALEKLLAPNSVPAKTLNSLNARKSARHIRRKNAMQTYLEDDVLHFYGLHQQPFILDENLDQDLVETRDLKTALKKLREVSRKAGMAVLSGPTGAGKTVILNRLVRELLQLDRPPSRRQKNLPYRIARLHPPLLRGVSPAAVCDAILQDLAPGTPIPPRSQQLANTLLRILRQHHEQAHHCILIVDEAHDLDPRMLRTIKRFNEFTDVAGRRLLAIILVGQLELHKKLAVNPDTLELARRAVVIQLRGIRSQAKEYLDKRLRRAGARGSIFSAAALRALANSRPVLYPHDVSEIAAAALRLRCHVHNADRRAKRIVQPDDIHAALEDWTQ